MSASVSTAVEPDTGRVPPHWRGAAVGLAVGLVFLGLLFQQEVVAAVQTWIDSTAYNHCFLIIPIAAYLAWDRRDTLRALAPTPLPWIALAALPLAVVWLAAERLGIMEGRQLVAMTVAETLFLGVLGWRLWWAAAGPTTLPAPGLPFSLVFRAEPGREDIVLKIASAYEAASKRRIPPPAFGPLAVS